MRGDPATACPGHQLQPTRAYLPRPPPPHLVFLLAVLLLALPGTLALPANAAAPRPPAQGVTGVRDIVAAALGEGGGRGTGTALLPAGTMTGPPNCGTRIAGGGVALTVAGRGMGVTVVGSRRGGRPVLPRAFSQVASGDGHDGGSFRATSPGIGFRR